MGPRGWKGLLRKRDRRGPEISTFHRNTQYEELRDGERMEGKVCAGRAAEDWRPGRASLLGQSSPDGGEDPSDL